MKREKNRIPARPINSFRQPRARGGVSRGVILNPAARLATTQGLEGLSLGNLAQHIGMSKSGLYAHFKHLERRIFPGGCFFASVAAQLASHPGRARNRVLQVQAAWIEQFTSALHQGREAGEIPRDSDLEQLVFEITAMLLRANFARIISNDKHVLDRARLGVEHALAREAQSQGKRRSPSKP